MKVLMINVVCGIRSTGRICTDLAVALEKEGHEVKIAYGREEVPKQFKKYAVKIGNSFDVKMHGLKARILDGSGFGSRFVTKRFIQWVEKFDPDVIHLHNIHGYYINIEILSEYLKRCGKKIIWTLHDCWSFTGHCVYFDYLKCNKWKEGCQSCPQRKQYPARWFIDCSKRNYYRKKEIFTDIPNLILITPSQWLADLIKQSYLKEYPVKVIRNGVDASVFKPTSSMLRQYYELGDKKVVLGVASVWDHRKGFGSFIELSKRLDKEYQIILVGLSPKQIETLPSNVIGIGKTDSIQHLASLYTLADVYVNPTLEDNYPTTNIESIACGTPVITYRTGGSVESAKMYGRVVEQNDIDALLGEIKSVEKIRREQVDIDYKETVKKYLLILSES